MSRSAFLVSSPSEISLLIVRALVGFPVAKISEFADAFAHLDDVSGKVFIELNLGPQILAAIKNGSNRDLQIAYLFCVSDLVDVDESGYIGRYFCSLSFVPEVIAILRSIEPRSEHETRLKTAGICALSSLCLHDIGKYCCFVVLFFCSFD